MKSKMLDKTVAKKSKDSFQAILSVILAVTLVFSLVPISQMTPVFAGSNDGGAASNYSTDAAASQGVNSALSSILSDSEGSADGILSDAEKQSILDSYLANGTISEKDLDNEFITDSLTGAYLEKERKDIQENGLQCGNCLESSSEDANKGIQDEISSLQVQDEYQIAQPPVQATVEQDVAQDGAQDSSITSILGNIIKDEAVPLASSGSSASAPEYSTKVVLKNIQSVVLYDNYGQAKTNSFFFNKLMNNPDQYCIYVQAYNMPAFYSPLVNAEVRSGKAYLTFRLPVANEEEEAQTVEVFYTSNMDPDTYVRGVAAQPAVTEATVSAAMAEVPGYDANREVAYRNAYKLAPFASYEDIVKSGNAIPETSKFYSKTIQELWPVHSEQGMKVSMFEGEEQDIVRNVVYFSDGTSETSDLEFIGANSLTASYTMGDAGLLYQPSFWVLGESAKPGIERVAAFIRSKTYNNYFAPFKSDVKMHRTVRDYFDNNIRDKAEEVAANLLTNIPTWNPVCSESKLWKYLMNKAETDMPSTDPDSVAPELKMFNLLFMYTYWDRFLNFGIGGSEETGYQNNANAFLIVAFRGGVIRSGLSLASMTCDVRTYYMASYAMVRSLSSSVVKNRMSRFTGITDAANLIRLLVQRTSDYADVANWFADYMSTISFYHEYKPAVIEGHPETEELIWRGWDQASRRYANYLPIWLTMEPGAMYMASTSMNLTCGSTYIYVAPADFEFNDAYRSSFQARLDARFLNLAKYSSTVATIVGKDRVNRTIVLTLDNMTSRYDSGSLQNIYYESHGLFGKLYTEDPWQKNFMDTVELYDTSGGQGAVAATYNVGPENKRILFFAYAALDSSWAYYWTHEMAHALDNDVFLGAGRRDGASNEDFTDGLLTQSHGTTSPIMNLCYDYNISADVMSNYERERIYGKENLNDFYKKMYETLDLLDYAALQAFLRLDKDEQNAVASQVWFSGQNGNSALDSGSNTSILCSRSKVINEYDGTAATMPVNASVFNDGSKKFETVEEVYDNQLFLRAGIADGASVTWQRQSYVSESNVGVWWFPVHANTFYPDSRSFKVMMYRMLGRHGYDAFATYGSAGGNDLQKLAKITGCSSYKEWQMKTWQDIEAKKGQLSYASFDDLVNKFESALKTDAAAHDRNLGSMSSLRLRMFYMMKRVTNDFRYGIYENQRPVTHIKTLSDLTKIADDPQGNYVLDNDIDATSIEVEPTKSLLSGVFYGKFDGQGHKIAVNGKPYSALFEGTHHAYVKNLVLEGIVTEKATLTDSNSEFENMVFSKFERNIWTVDDFVGINNDLVLGINVFHLMADLDFTEWSAANAAAATKSLSVVTRMMSGTADIPKKLNGNGHTITGLSGAALFDKVCFTEIRGLSIKNSGNRQDAASGDNVSLVARRSAKSVFEDLYFDTVEAEGRYRAGFVVGDDGAINQSGGNGRIGGSRFERIQVTNGKLWNGNSSVQGSCCYAGFVAGRVTNSDLTDIFVEGSFASYGVSCGGVVGAITCSARLNRCVSKVSMSATLANRANGIVIGDIENSSGNPYDAGNTKISACFGLGVPNANVARLAKMTAPAQAAFENCYENISNTAGQTLFGANVPGVSYARTDMEALNHVSEDVKDVSYKFPILCFNNNLYNSLGFSSDVWEFDPTIEAGYPMLRYVGDKATFSQYDMDIKVDYKNEKIVCSGSSFDLTKRVCLNNLPFRSPFEPGKGEWSDIDYKSATIPFVWLTEDPNSVDISEIIEYEGFKNVETDFKGTRTVSLYLGTRWSGKSYAFVKTVEIPPRAENPYAGSIRGIRADADGMGSIHVLTIGSDVMPAVEYRPVAQEGEDAAAWIPTTSSSTRVPAGTYEVRAAATDNSFASYPSIVEVGEYDASATSFPLVLDPNGGVLDDKHSGMEAYEGASALALPNSGMISRPGYTFEGWFAKDAKGSFTGNAMKVIPAGSSGAVVLYAKWTRVGSATDDVDTPAPGKPTTGGPAQGGGSPLVVSPIMSVYSANALTGKLTLANGKSFGLKGASLVKREGINFPTTRKVTYTSSNPKVATVSASGKVKANKKKTGKAKITITSVDNPANKKVITVTVVKKAKYKAAKKVLKTSLKATYKANSKKQVKVTVKKWSPAKPSNKNFVVTVSPKSRATVDPATNKVTFKKKGKVTVTVKSTSDPKAKIKVKVKVK